VIQFGGSDDSDTDLDDNDSSLPFPQPLARSAFRGADFDPTSFLSSLANRFQTLEDLQAELRGLGQTLKEELLDLVNDNYQDFLALGTTLSGGEERVEEVRVGLLGFQRELASIKAKADSRREEVAKLLEEKRKLKHDIRHGRALLDIAERLDELETQLMIGEAAAKKSMDEDGYDSLSDVSDGESGSDDGDGRRVRKLKRLVEELSMVNVLLHRYGKNDGFLQAQRPRLLQIQQTLRVDVDSALKQEGADPKPEQEADEGSLKTLLQLRSSLQQEIHS